jgi:two-component system, cell cycle response regulator
MGSLKTLVLAVPSEQSAQNLAARLKMQGYAVEVTTSGVDAARAALVEPPAAVIADLWMPGVSGVQLCRLLRREPSTETVPVILRGPEGRRNRFWAERAGAAAYVASGRMGDLVRALEAAIAAAPAPDAFFTDLRGGHVDIRDRIAGYLDDALYESVIASEVRALGTSGSFERVFDLFSQFVARVTSYRWLSVSTDAPACFGLHTNPESRVANERAAREALSLPETAPVIAVEDEDAYDDESGPSPIVLPISFGPSTIGKIALATREPEHAQDRKLVTAIARELGGPLRMAMLVEESHRLATIDPLTGLKNRRAFVGALTLELEQCDRHGHPVSVMLLDVDHFKSINDRFGHATGDLVLAAVGKILRAEFREVDVVARWGGEEFVVALSGAAADGVQVAAERLRQAIAATLIARPGSADPVRVAVSIGVARRRSGECLDSLVDRADRAMYGAKTMGRNRVVIETECRASSRPCADDGPSELESRRWKAVVAPPS